MTKSSFECCPEASGLSVELDAKPEGLGAFGFCVAGCAVQNVRVVWVRTVPAGDFGVSGGRIGRSRFREFVVAMATARQTRLRRMAAVWTMHLRAISEE